MEWAVAPLIVTTQWRGDVVETRQNVRRQRWKNKSEHSEQILADGVNGTCLQWQVNHLFLDIGCVVPGYLHVFTCIYRFEVLTWYGRTPCVDLSIWWEVTGWQDGFCWEHLSFHQPKLCSFSARRQWLSSDVGAGGSSAAQLQSELGSWHGDMVTWHRSIRSMLQLQVSPASPSGPGHPYLGSVQLCNCNSFENETNLDIFDIFVSASDFDIDSHLLQAIQLFGISSEWFQRTSATCDRGRWQIGSGLLWQLGRGIWTFRTKLGWGRRLKEAEGRPLR